MIPAMTPMNSTIPLISSSVRWGSMDGSIAQIGEFNGDLAPTTENCG